MTDEGSGDVRALGLPQPWPGERGGRRGHRVVLVDESAEGVHQVIAQAEGGEVGGGADRAAPLQSGADVVAVGLRVGVQGRQVDPRRLGEHDRGRHRVDQRGVRPIELGDGEAVGAQGVEGAGHGGGDVGPAVAKGGAEHADARRRRPGRPVEQTGRGGRRPGQRHRRRAPAQMIERGGEREHAGGAQAAAGLVADDAAQGGGDAARPPGIGADGHIGETQSDGRGRTRAGTAGDEPRIDGVRRRPLEAVDAGDPEAELVEPGGADQPGPALEKTGHQRGVVPLGRGRLAAGRAGPTGTPGDRDQVLDREAHAGERAGRPCGRLAGLRRLPDKWAVGDLDPAGRKSGGRRQPSCWRRRPGPLRQLAGQALPADRGTSG